MIKVHTLLELVVKLHRVGAIDHDRAEPLIIYKGNKLLPETLGTLTIQ